jgi:hypothetical protein
MAAAISVKTENPTANVIIIERLERTGKKILATGNGRCNLSNRNISAENYHGSVKDIIRIIRETPTAEEFFGSMGVLCTSDGQGRIYPTSNSAATVLNALRIRLNQLGVIEICGFEVETISGHDGNFAIYSNSSSINCRKIIIAAGGYAAPSFGTDGNMIRLLKKSGYSTSKICPAIAPLRVDADSLRGLKGVRVKGKISAVSYGKVIREETGEIQFTENSLSGICVFNLAYLFSEYEGKLKLRADLMPDMSTEQIEKYIFSIKNQRYECTLEELLTGMFSRNLAIYLTKNTLERPLSDKIRTLKFDEVYKLSRKIKALDFVVSGCSPWKNAQATSGGIHGDCVDGNLESRLNRGIYFAGEILDVDGECGGYNLQWAWSSGIRAGKKCAESLKTGD